MDEDHEIIPVEIDRETRIRLAKLAVATGARPTALAAALLRDVLLEDELYNEPRTLN